VTFPAIAGSIATDGSTAAADPPVNLPTGIVAGELLWITFSSTTTYNDAATVPSGWTRLWIGRPTGDTRSGDKDQLLYRLADGTEGATVNVSTNGSSVKHSAIAYRISNWDSSVPPEFASAAGTSANPDSPSLTPTYGQRDTLWFSVYIIEGTGGSATTIPTNYTSAGVATVATTGGSAATNHRQMRANRSLNAATEDPSAWTAPASEDWAAYTIAFPGVASAASLLIPAQGRRTYTRM
jgi:hypothetical protein